MNENINLKKCSCPGCGASININSLQKTVNCDYCGMSFRIDDEKADGNSSRITYTSEDYQKIGKTAAIIIIACICSFIGILIIIGIIGAVISTKKISENQVFIKDELVEMNPYENIEIKLGDIEPWGRIEKVKGPDELSRLEYKVSKSEGLSNGDKVRITAGELKGYSWTEEYYEYTVEGLDELVTDVSMLSDSDKELIYSEAKDLLIKKWEKNIEDCKFTTEDIQLEIEPYNLYINVSQYDYYGSYLDNNIVMPAFKTTFENNDKTYTIYQYVELSNVIITGDGQLKADFNTMSAYSGLLFGNDYGFKNQYFAIYGYDGILQMESAMAKDKYKLIK